MATFEGLGKALAAPRTERGLHQREPADQRRKVDEAEPKPRRKPTGKSA